MSEPTIYHYTGLDAFRKIVESGCIRAMHYSHFGDKKEVRLGVQLLLDAVRRHAVEPCDIEYRDFLVDGIAGFADGRLPIYVLSLTERRDSAHHWREYAPGGVAIEFCRDRVEKGFPIDISRRVPGMKVPDPVRPDPGNRFMQCRYVSTFDLSELVSRRFFGASSYPAAFRSKYARSSGFVYPCLSASIYQTICAIKGPDFLEDAEWRCVHVNPDLEDYPVKTENGGEFIEMQFTPADFVREVWVGPHDRRRHCEDAIEVLRQAGILRCSLMVSSL